MADSRSRLATLICTVVVLSLLVSCVITTALLWAFGDWDKHGWGLTLALKIMWAVWLIVLVSTALTYVTMFGWHYRRPRPGEWPAALRRVWSEGVTPPAWFKSSSASFAITVVLVSLFGAAFLASVLLWVIGDWSGGSGPLVLTLKIVWGSWWVLAIATVLVRVAIFGNQWKRGQQQKAGEAPPGPPGADGTGGSPVGVPPPPPGQAPGPAVPPIDKPQPSGTRHES